MMPHLPTRRAAEELDAALSGTASTAVAERHADLLATVQVLRAVPQVEPRPEFVADLRSRLMLAAETDLAPAPPVVRRTGTSRTRQRAGSVAAALVIVGGTAGMAAAASGSLPGEALYPIKRGGEQVAEAVRLTDAAKGRALLGQAENRLGEVRALMASGQADPTLVSTTLDAFTTAADSGSDRLFESYQRDGDAADVSSVRDFTSSQMRVIDQLVASSDQQQSSVLLDAADTLADIDQQARTLCGDCGSPTALTTPAALSEGAAAASIQNLLARPALQAQADIAAAREAAARQQSADLADAAKQAQETADATPLAVLPPAGTSTSSRGGQTTGPVPGAVSGSSQLVPTVKAGTTAVDGLVDSLTDQVDATTGGATAPVTDPLRTTTSGVTGGLDSTLDTVDGTLGGLLP